MSASPSHEALAIGVTGGIASGKSEVTRRFEALGVEVLDADLISRELVEPGQPALALIVEAFGADMLDPGGRLDRGRLRARVFADAGARRELEQILHPRVRDALAARTAAARGPYVMLAIPLLVESGHYSWLARILVVDVPEAVQLARVLKRDRVERATAQAMIAAQATRAQRLAAATDIIVNDGPLDALDAIVARLHRHFLDIVPR